MILHISNRLWFLFIYIFVTPVSKCFSIFHARVSKLITLGSYFESYYEHFEKVAYTSKLLVLDLCHATIFDTVPDDVVIHNHKIVFVVNS